MKHLAKKIDFRIIDVLTFVADRANPLAFARESNDSTSSLAIIVAGKNYVL